VNQTASSPSTESHRQLWISICFYFRALWCFVYAPAFLENVQNMYVPRIKETKFAVARVLMALEGFLLYSRLPLQEYVCDNCLLLLAQGQWKSYRKNLRRG